MRTILKFDVGKDGFDRMIFVLAVAAVLVLILGIVFLTYSYKPLGEKGA